MDFGVLNKWSVTPHVTGPAVGECGLVGPDRQPDPIYTVASSS